MVSAQLEAPAASRFGANSIGLAGVLEQVAKRMEAGISPANQVRHLPPTVALANKMARIIWALLVKGGTYRTPTAAA